MPLSISPVTLQAILTIKRQATIFSIIFYRNNIKLNFTSHAIRRIQKHYSFLNQTVQTHENLKNEK